jgi:hypothetical protein
MTTVDVNAVVGLHLDEAGAVELARLIGGSPRFAPGIARAGRTDADPAAPFRAFEAA